MPFGRRHFLIAGTAFASTAGIGGASASGGTRELALFHGDSRIGSQSLAVSREGDLVNVRLELDVAVRVFGLTVFRHALDAREEWRSGRLTAAEATTNANGTRMSMRAAREGDALLVDGTGFSGRVTGNPATTSYWSPAFLSRGIWIDLEDGRPLRVTARNLGVTRFPTTSGAVEAARWRIGGEADPVDLFYDASGEWVGNEFEAQGDTARFVVADRGPALTALWVDS